VKSYPSGNILIICFPMIRDVLCMMLAGRTLFSDMDISLSKNVLARTRSHPSMGICFTVSICRDYDVQIKNSQESGTSACHS
jgi:hypothetical protein